MENQSIQYLTEFIEKIKHSLDEQAIKVETMSKEELVKFVKDNCLLKKSQLRSIITLMYFATQETYLESKEKNNDDIFRTFQILEGTVTLDLLTGVYTFTPYTALDNLFIKAEETDKTKIREVLESRFYRLVEALYKTDYEGLSKPKKKKSRNKKEE